MAFHFALATVLRARSIIEEREERMLRQILFEIGKTIESIAQTGHEINGSNATRRSEILQTSLGRNVWESYDLLEELKLNRKRLEDRLEKLEQLREKQFEVYKNARMNREMITGMHSEGRAAYDADVSRREQRDLDDNYIACKRRL
jgi:flagellar biosynthesis chaperone FliJ